LRGSRKFFSGATRADLKQLLQKLRALRVLRGENYPFFFGCGFAALGNALFFLKLVERDHVAG
jgi:hypothetical protein